MLVLMCSGHHGAKIVCCRIGLCLKLLIGTLANSLGGMCILIKACIGFF